MERIAEKASYFVNEPNTVTMLFVIKRHSNIEYYVLFEEIPHINDAVGPQKVNACLKITADKTGKNCSKSFQHE